MTSAGSPNSSPASVGGQCPTNLVSTQCVKAREPNDPVPQGKETIQIYDYPALLAPNTPSTDTQGMALFVSTGCSLCHHPQYTTMANAKLLTDFAGHTTLPVNALSNQPVNLYSDLLLHHLGPALADCMQFGQAQGDQWRTTPLWGLSTRTVYLHDGPPTTARLQLRCTRALPDQPPRAASHIRTRNPTRS